VFRKRFGRKGAAPVQGSAERPPLPLTESDRVAQLVAKLNRDIEKDIDDELGSTSADAAQELVKIGQTAVGPLIAALPRTSWAHYALGQIGGEQAVQSLCRELETRSWRRVQAAADALGRIGDPSALQPLHAHDGTCIAEIHQAVTWAIAQIERRQIGEDRLFAVDHAEPARQVDRLWALQRNLRQDAADRFIQWHQEFVTAMPDLAFDSDATRGRVWGMLGIMIYYLRNPKTSVITLGCPEAAYCFEQCLQSTPGRDDIRGYLKRTAAPTV
jgi:hypothetical protein